MWLLTSILVSTYQEHKNMYGGKWLHIRHLGDEFMGI